MRNRSQTTPNPPTHLNGVLLASHSHGVRVGGNNVQRCSPISPQNGGIIRAHEVEVGGAAECFGADLLDPYPVTALTGPQPAAVTGVGGDRFGHDDFGGAVFLNTIGASLAAEVGNEEATVIVLLSWWDEKQLNVRVIRA